MRSFLGCLLSVFMVYVSRSQGKNFSGDFPQILFRSSIAHKIFRLLCYVQVPVPGNQYGPVFCFGVNGKYPYNPLQYLPQGSASCNANGTFP